MKHFYKKYKDELISMGVAFLWLLVCLASKMVEETNDDIAIAFMIAHSPEHLCAYVHPAYSKLLGVFFAWIPKVNWWSVFSLLGITAGVYVFGTLILKKLTGLKKWIALTAMLLLVYIVAIDLFNFTRTAGVISLAGLVLIVESACDQTKPILNRILTGIGAVVLMLWGSSVRKESFLMCIPFCAGYFVSKLFLSQDRAEQIRHCWKNWVIRGGVLTAVLLSVFMHIAGGTHWLTSDPEWADYIRYNKARAVSADYKGLPAYKDNEAAYRAIDVSETELEMIQGWITENPDSITTEKMVALAELSDARVDWKTAAYTVYGKRNRPAFLIAAIIVLVCICLGRVDDWIYIACMSAGGVATAVYIAKGGRFPSRVFDVVCLNIAITSLLGSRLEGFAWYRNWSKRIRRNIPFSVGKIMERMALSAAFLAVCIYVVQGFSGSAWYWQRWNRTMQRVRRIEEQQDRMYVLMANSPLASDVVAYGMWNMPQNGASRNIFQLGGWEARAPYILKIREQQGINNPFTALIEKPNVYSTANEQVLDSLRKYYQDYVTESTVDEMDDIEIIQYSRPIEVNSRFGDEKQYDLMISETEDGECWQIRIDADMNEFVQYEDVRLNLLTKDGLRTFRIRRDENGFSAKLYERYEGIAENASLIGLRQDGIYETAGSLKVHLN